MGPLQQPDNLTVLPQFFHSLYLCIHTFSLPQLLPPPPKSSLSVDDLTSYLEKTKATKRKSQQTPTISVIHLPEPTPTHSALYPCFYLKVTSLPYVLDLILQLSNITNFLYLIILMCMQTYCYFSHSKIKTSLTIQPPIPLFPFVQKILKSCLHSGF